MYLCGTQGQKGLKTHLLFKEGVILGQKPHPWVFFTPFLPLADKFIDQRILFISDLNSH